jgi:uncharacterized damage-inducible protein DinB
MNAHHIFRFWDREIHPTTLLALRSLTDEQLDWKPQGWHSSARDLAVHMCNVEWVWIYRNALRLESWDTRWKSKEFRTWPELLAYWENVHAASTDWLMNTPMSELDKQYALPYDQSPLAPLHWIVNHVIEHEIHHRGQLFMLMRMQGINPPEI